MDDQHIESRGHMIWLACVICPIITGIFVILRAYARIFITRKVSASDWVCFITLVWTIAFSVTLAQATYTGMGRHTQDFTEELSEGMKFWILVSSVFYVLSLAGYKAALVLLYLQIFGINRKFRYTCYAVLAYTMGYLFCNLIVQVAGCTPVEKFWIEKTPGHCTKNVAQNIAFGVGHMSSDLMIALLPLPMVWKLQLRNKKEKIGLFFVLGAGVIAWIVAVIRFIYATVDLTAADRTWIAGATFFLSVLEVNTGLICGCTPALKPLFISIKESTSNAWSRKMSNGYGYSGRKNSTSYFSRKRSEGGDLHSPGGSIKGGIHGHGGKGFTELKNITGSGVSSGDSAPSSRRPTISTPVLNLNESKIKTNAAPPPVPRNPGSDTWDDYAMTYNQTPLHHEKPSQHPPVVQSRLGAPRIPHMDSDELFKGYAGAGGVSSKHKNTDDLEAQHDHDHEPEEHETDPENEQNDPHHHNHQHRAQPSNPNEQSVRDFLADGPGPGPSQPVPRPPPQPSQQRGGFVPRAPKGPSSQSQPQSQPQLSQPQQPRQAPAIAPPAPKPFSDTAQATAHYATRAQILLEQVNRPPSDRGVPQVQGQGQGQRPPAPTFDSQELFSGTALHPVHEAGARRPNKGVDDLV